MYTIDLKPFKITKTFGRLVLATLVMLLTTALFTGCVTQRLDPTVAQDIPDGANRIILETATDIPPTTDITPKSLFMNTIAVLADEGYRFDVADYDSYILSTTPRQIRGDLAIKIDTKIADDGINGPTLIASAQWAPTVLADEGQWQEARWTNDRARAAFTEAISALHEVQYTILYAETELGVAEETGS